MKALAIPRPGTTALWPGYSLCVCVSGSAEDSRGLMNLASLVAVGKIRETGAGQARGQSIEELLISYLPTLNMRYNVCMLVPERRSIIWDQTGALIFSLLVSQRTLAMMRRVATAVAAGIMIGRRAASRYLRRDTSSSSSSHHSCRRLSSSSFSSSSSPSSSSSSSSSSPPSPSGTVLVGGQVVPFERKRHHPSEPERLTCTSCGYIHYENPKIVVGSVATLVQEGEGGQEEEEDLVLLCRRAIPPRVGLWNLCAGYMEKGETMQEGVVREAWEEAYARLDSLRLLSMYDIAHIGQVHIYYRARLLNRDVSCGDESLEVRLFRWQDIPWGELAFPTVSWALMHYAQSKQQHHPPLPQDTHSHRKVSGNHHPSNKMVMMTPPTTTTTTTTTDGGSSSRSVEMTMPFSNPVLRGYEGSTNVWWRPDRGLFYDDKWLTAAPAAAQ